MAWKVLTKLKHDMQVFNPGEVIDHLEADVARELEQSGVIKNLEADASKVEQVAATAAGKVEKSEELARGQVDNQVGTAVAKDLQDNKTLQETEGQTVNPGGQPTPEQVAATAAGVK